LPTTQQAEAGSVVAPNLIRTRWLVQISDIPRARDARRRGQRKVFFSEEKKQKTFSLGVRVSRATYAES
jgi:hypothetical protein